MPLELRKESKWWYGRFEVDGKRYCINLDVEVAGRRPTSARKTGDAAFENSRGAAKAALKAQVALVHSKQAAIRNLEQAYEIKTGDTIGTVPLNEMFKRWDEAAGKKDRAPKYVLTMRQLIKRFTDFVAENHPKTTALAQVTPTIAKAFMASVSKDRKTGRQITGRTFNSIAIMLRSVFKALGPEAGLPANPFAVIHGRPMNTEHRQPFTVEQLATVLRVADPLVRPLIITGMCTAMRKGDCCLLKWSDVDLALGFIRVKTSKTGETAEIPIFPLLRQELAARPRAGEYVFPEAAELYLRNPHGITALTKQAFEAAGITTTKKREDGQNSASVHDFHSLRTTWITLALSAGIPMELVRRVTGHQTVDVVLKHYFRPGREDFQKVLTAGMPKLLTGGEALQPETPLDTVEAILRAMTPETLEADRARALAVIAKAKAAPAA